MTDPLKKLEDAFRESKVASRATAKHTAISAAMHAFEAEKTSPGFQGSEDGARLNKQGGKSQTLLKWRRMMNTINPKFAWSLAGSASIAVLAMVAVAPNLDDILSSRYQSGEVSVAKPAPSDTVAEGRAHVAPSEPAVTQVPAPQVPAPQVLSDQVTVKQSRPVAKRALAPQAAQGRSLQSESAVRVLPLPAPVDLFNPGYQDQGRDTFEAFETNPVKITREAPVSTFSVDVDTASYAFMRSSLNNNVVPAKDAIRIEELINYFDYAYEAPTDKATPFKANVSIMPTPWNDGTKLLSIGIKGYELQRDEAPAANLVFLIDTSGSMNAPDKLPLLRNAFKLLLNSLKPDDTISIVAYAGSAGTVLQPTRAAETATVMAALDRLQAGGSTAGAEGIRQAYALAQSGFKEDGVNRVILATDGDFNVGISDPHALKGFVERKRDSGITLSVLGFGRGNYNDQLMQTLAQNGNGNANYIDTLSEARKVLVEEAGSTLFTIAKDVKLQVEFNPALVEEYRLIGYETRALAREDFNNDKVDAGDIGAGHTVTALYEITPAGSGAALVDGLRYGSEAVKPADPAAGNQGEYAFLKIRYKLLGSDESTLITRPIRASDAVASQELASDDARFAASVAAFGQMLRGGQYTKDFTHDAVIALAQSAKGEDPFGYRAEFINLVRLAQLASELEPLNRQ